MSTIANMLYTEKPLFHHHRDGQPCSWAGNKNRLADIELLLKPGMSTIETGAGYSTVVFLAKGCNHTTLTFDSREVDRIHAYCCTKSIPYDKHVYFFGDSTQTAKNVSGSFDFVFIDGAHRFPHPIIDWYNLNAMLKVGGFIVIDDTDIIGCHIIAKFLSNDPEHELVKKADNYAIFRKIEYTPTPGDWPSQPFSANKILSDADILGVLGL